ncbi:MAG: DinB family protein [Mycobacteriales bacterium]
MNDPRFNVTNEADERALLAGFLDWQRQTLNRKCSGLTDVQLRLHAIPSSNLTLLGLLRHLTGVERWWVRTVLGKESPGELHDETDDFDEDFNKLDTATREQALAAWRAEVAEADRVIAAHSLGDEGTHPGSGQQHSLHWVMLHMIDEYARHLGHADLLREAIDGEAGE